MVPRLLSLRRSTFIDREAFALPTADYTLPRENPARFGDTQEVPAELDVEYLHLQFDGITEDASISFSGAAQGFQGGPISIIHHGAAYARIDIVCVGVNYLFNWGPAPFVSK